MKELLGLIVSKITNLLTTFVVAHKRKSFFTNGSEISNDFKLGADNYLEISPKAKFFFGKGVFINQSNFITAKPGAKLSIGNNTYITRATISCLGEIEIGANCVLGEGMKLFDHNHVYTRNPFHVSKTDFNIGKIKIGNNVWTGANVVILKDVTIGDNVILGAGCVVHKDVPANTILINKQEHLQKSI